VTFLDDLIKQARDYDAARPRSVQSAVGWSEAGGCRAYLGYRLQDTWASDDTDTWAAQRGTAIHEYLQGILAGPGVRCEVDTIYRGIPGHADLVDATSCTDLKTTRLSSSRMWAANEDVLLQKRVQVHGYGAGLVDAGELPEDATMRLMVIPVDGTFADWWCYEEPFDRSLADQGADRVESVRDMLADGVAPPKDMPYAWCLSYCQFASICRTHDDHDDEVITDPELVASIARYGETAKQITALYKEKDGLAEVIRGLRGTAGDWRISLSKAGEPKPVLDEEAIRADYERRGFAPPMTTKPGAAPRLNVTRIKKKAAAK
jgi:hypothetical protein